MQASSAPVYVGRNVMRYRSDVKSTRSWIGNFLWFCVSYRMILEWDGNPMALEWDPCMRGAEGVRMLRQMLYRKKSRTDIWQEKVTKVSQFSVIKFLIFFLFLSFINEYLECFQHNFLHIYVRNEKFLKFFLIMGTLINLTNILYNNEEKC